MSQDAKWILGDLRIFQAVFNDLKLSHEMVTLEDGTKRYAYVYDGVDPYELGDGAFPTVTQELAKREREAQDTTCKRCGNSKLEGVPPSEMPSIADALEFRRDQNGWTKTQMASALGWEKSHYTELLQGKRRLPYEKACIAFNELGIPPVVLLQPQLSKDNTREEK